MYHKNYWTESTNTALTLDKNARKEYNERNKLRKNIGIFDNDADADSALDYLYADANQSKTQGFLKNNGFPTAQDRAMNQRLYGASEEQERTRGLLRRTAADILKPDITEIDRGFLQGIYGDAKGESEYQNMVSDANRRQSDLYNTFRGSQFESVLRPTIPSSSASDARQHVSDGKQNSTSELERVAVLNSTQKRDITPYTDSKKSPSGLQNRDHSDKGFWHMQETFGPPKEIKPIGTLPKAVRANVENAGGSVKWDSKTNKATIRINGYTEDFYPGDGYGTFIQNGVMYTDNLHLDNLLYAPTNSYAKTMYDEIEDDFGKFVLRTWLFGDGSEVKVSGERWNSFIKNNPKVQEKFEETVQQAIGAGKSTFDIEKSVALSEDGEGGYGSGYELINGSNHNVGGFALQGNISPIGNGKYLVTIDYTFNDIIDPNKTYFTDRYYSAAADFLGVTGKDYTLRISGTAIFTYSAEEGIIYE